MKKKLKAKLSEWGHSLGLVWLYALLMGLVLIGGGLALAWIVTVFAVVALAALPVGIYLRFHYRRRDVRVKAGS